MKPSLSVTSWSTPGRFWFHMPNVPEDVGVVSSSCAVVVQWMTNSSIYSTMAGGGGGGGGSAKALMHSWGENRSRRTHAVVLAEMIVAEWMMLGNGAVVLQALEQIHSGGRMPKHEHEQGMTKEAMTGLDLRLAMTIERRHAAWGTRLSGIQ